MCINNIYIYIALSLSLSIYIYTHIDLLVLDVVVGVLFSIISYFSLLLFFFGWIRGNLNMGYGAKEF